MLNQPCHNQANTTKDTAVFHQLCKEAGVEATVNTTADSGWYVRLHMPSQQVSWVSKIHTSLAPALVEANAKLSKLLPSAATV